MKTEDLVSLLSTGAEAVDPRLVARRCLLALGGGTLIAFLITAGLLKLNPALWHEMSQPMFWVRESYCAALVYLGSFPSSDWLDRDSGSAWPPWALQSQ